MCGEQRIMINTTTIGLEKKKYNYVRSRSRTFARNSKKIPSFFLFALCTYSPAALHRIPLGTIVFASLFSCHFILRASTYNKRRECISRPIFRPPVKSPTCDTIGRGLWKHSRKFRTRSTLSPRIANPFEKRPFFFFSTRLQNATRMRRVQTLHYSCKYLLNTGQMFEEQSTTRVFFLVLPHPGITWPYYYPFPLRAFPPLQFFSTFS